MQISLPLKPLSYNAYYRNSRTGKRIKTGKGLAFDEELALVLEDYSDELVLFGRSIDPSINIVKLTMIVGNPDFFIKDGSRISKTCGDIDNYIKVIQDKLFNVIGVDDYTCRHLEVLDFYSVKESTLIHLEIKPILQGIYRKVVLTYPPILDGNTG